MPLYASFNRGMSVSRCTASSAKTGSILKENGAKSIDVCCVHAVLANNGAVKIYSAGAGKIIATNSLSSDTSRISLSKSIANVLRE